MTLQEHDDLHELIRIYQSKHSAGGNLHIILEDLNDDVEDANFCLRIALEDKDYLGAHIAQQLANLGSKEKITAFFEGAIWELEDEELKEQERG
jgi:hypothetical protein